MKVQDITLVLIMGIVSVKPVVGAELSANQIVATADAIMNPDAVVYVKEMKIVRPKRPTKTMRLKMYMKGDNKIFLEFLAPLREKGKKVLRNGDNMWLYLPTISRSIRISAKQKTFGGNFSNGDIMRLNLVKDYNATFVDIVRIGGIEAYLLELKAKDRSISYDKIIYWIRKDNFLPIRREFYTSSGKLIKTLTFSGIKKIGGRLRPTELRMESTLSDEKSIMVDLEIDTSVEIPDEIFTKQYLERN
ncbi:MAG: outer membrane lipoprotein-sorting protein [bacterium]